jgi:hypothetical protein
MAKNKTLFKKGRYIMWSKEFDLPTKEESLADNREYIERIKEDITQEQYEAYIKLANHIYGNQKLDEEEFKKLEKIVESIDEE